MKVTARRLEAQRKDRFAKLFERVYPDGASNDLKPWEHREAVKKRLNVFEVRGNEVLVTCEDCGKHFLIREYSIVDALKRGTTINCCSCGTLGSLLPVYRR